MHASFASSNHLFLLVLFVKALHEGLGKLIPVKILANENKFVDALLALRPGILGGSKVDLLVNTLEDELGISLPMEAEQTLGPVKIRRAVLEQVHHEHVEPLSVEVPLELDANALNEIEVVLLLFLFLILEKVGCVRENGLHIEGITLEDCFEGGTGALGFNDRGKLIELGEPCLEGLLLVLGDKIDLVEQDLIGKGHLLLRFIDGTLGLDLVQVLINVFAISETNDGIDAIVIGHLGVSLDRVDNGRGVGEAGGLQKDGIELLAALGKLTKSADEISTDGTAHTSVVHGDQVLGRIEGFGDKAIIDGDLSYHRGAFARDLRAKTYK